MKSERAGTPLTFIKPNGMQFNHPATKTRLSGFFFFVVTGYRDLNSVRVSSVSVEHLIMCWKV